MRQAKHQYKKVKYNSSLTINYTILIVYDTALSTFHEMTLLGTELFWERPSSDPLFKWEKWQTQLKLALLVKEK